MISSVENYDLWSSLMLTIWGIMVIFDLRSSKLMDPVSLPSKTISPSVMIPLSSAKARELYPLISMTLNQH